MSFWLELRMRHFHYCLSKCILLGAVKSMEMCVRARTRPVWVSKRKRVASLDDETHLITFLIWCPPPTPPLLPGREGQRHLHKWDASRLSPDWLSSCFYTQKPRPIISSSLTLNKTIRHVCSWRGVVMAVLNTMLHAESSEDLYLLLCLQLISSKRSFLSEATVLFGAVRTL